MKRIMWSKTGNLRHYTEDGYFSACHRNVKAWLIMTKEAGEHWLQNDMCPDCRVIWQKEVDARVLKTVLKQRARQLARTASDISSTEIQNVRGDMPIWKKG